MGAGRRKLARILKSHRGAEGKEIYRKRDERSRPEGRPVDLVEKSVFHLTTRRFKRVLYHNSLSLGKSSQSHKFVLS